MLRSLHTHTHTRAKLYSIVYYKRVFLLFFFIFFWPTAYAILFISSPSHTTVLKTGHLQHDKLASVLYTLYGSPKCCVSIAYTGKVSLASFFWSSSKKENEKERNHTQTEGQKKRIEKYQLLYTIYSPSIYPTYINLYNVLYLLFSVVYLHYFLLDFILYYLYTVDFLLFFLFLIIFFSIYSSEAARNIKFPMGKWGGNPIDKRLCEERWDRIEVSFMN